MKTIKSVVLAFSLLGLLIAFTAFGEEITIMTSNICDSSSGDYEAEATRCFQGLDPDVVLIQEFKVASGTLRNYVDTAFGSSFDYWAESDTIPNGVISRWTILTAGEWPDSTGAGSNRDYVWAVIDIPGAKNLQVVSCHLYGSGSATERNTEATEIKNRVAANFDSDHYIVVGGDINTQNRTETCITTFKSFLDADDHTPDDHNGNSNTNEPRSYDYDWVMPNSELDQYHTTTYVGTGTYTDGIVFDSRVFPNVTTEVSPVQTSDCGSFQHMPVMKTYDIPTYPEMINEGFDDFETGTRPSGWTFTNCNLDSDTYTTIGNYGVASPSIKMDETGDVITSAGFSSPIEMSFWYKGLGTDATCSLLIEELYASSWHTVTSINPLSSSGGDHTLELYSSTSQVRFAYSKSAGNLAFDDVVIYGNGSVITPTPTPIISTTRTPTPPPSTTPTPQPTATPIITTTTSAATTSTTTTTLTTTTTTAVTTTTTTTAAPTTTTTTVVTTTTTTTAAATPTPVPATPTPPTLRPAVVGDYDGDGTSDPALYRPSVGLWLIRGLPRVYFGGTADEPVPADYDGDGTWDYAYYRPAISFWKVRNVTQLYFGNAGDEPVPADYDGDGSDEIAFFRPAEKLWNALDTTRFYFGASTDQVMAYDFDGDGADDPGIYRESTGMWRVRNLTQIYFGDPGDQPVPADYNGDGTVDIAYFRPSVQLWKVHNLTQTYFAKSSDVAFPADFNGDGTADYSYFRPSVLLWRVKGVTRLYMGQSSDTQITNPW